MTIGVGRSAMIRSVAAKPSSTGISTSMSTTSGRQPQHQLHGLGAVGGLADDARCPTVRPRMRRSTARTVGESSTSSTRSGVGLAVIAPPSLADHGAASSVASSPCLVM